MISGLLIFISIIFRFKTDLNALIPFENGDRYFFFPRVAIVWSLILLMENKKLFNTSLNPSSEWRFHQDIYLKKKEAKAIVHAHSPHATAVSAHGKAIPAFHYMIALAGGDDIKCAEYATFGTTELSKNIIKSLENRKACLMSNHGQVAFGVNLKQAFELAEEVENICHQYIIALKIGNPKILSSVEMNKILDKIKHYKKA